MTTLARLASKITRSLPTAVPASSMTLARPTNGIVRIWISNASPGTVLRVRTNSPTAWKENPTPSSVVMCGSPPPFAGWPEGGDAGGEGAGGNVSLIQVVTLFKLTMIG